MTISSNTLPPHTNRSEHTPQVSDTMNAEESGHDTDENTVQLINAIRGLRGGVYWKVPSTCIDQRFLKPVDNLALGARIQSIFNDLYVAVDEDLRALNSAFQKLEVTTASNPSSEALQEKTNAANLVQQISARRNEDLTQLDELLKEIQWCTNQGAVIDTFEALACHRLSMLTNHFKVLKNDCRNILPTDMITTQKWKSEFHPNAPEDFDLFHRINDRTEQAFTKALNLILKELWDSVDKEALTACEDGLSSAKTERAQAPQHSIMRGIASGKVGFFLQLEKAMSCSPQLMKFIDEETLQTVSMDEAGGYGIFAAVQTYCIDQGYVDEMDFSEIQAVLYAIPIVYATPFPIERLFLDHMRDAKGRFSKAVSQLNNGHLKESLDEALKLANMQVARSVQSDSASWLDYFVQHYNDDIDINATLLKLKPFLFIAMDPGLRDVLSGYDGYLATFHGPDIPTAKIYFNRRVQLGSKVDLGTITGEQLWGEMDIPADQHPAAPTISQVEWGKLKPEIDESLAFFPVEDGFFENHNSEDQASHPDGLLRSDITRTQNDKPQNNEPIDECQPKKISEIESTVNTMSGEKKDYTTKRIASNSNTTIKRVQPLLDPKRQGFIDQLLMSPMQRIKYRNVALGLSQIGWAVRSKKGGGSHRIVTSRYGDVKTGISESHGNDNRYLSIQNTKRLADALRRAGYRPTDEHANLKS